MRTAIITIYFGLKIAFHWAIANVWHAVELLFFIYFLLLLYVAAIGLGILAYALWPFVALVAGLSTVCVCGVALGWLRSRWRPKSRHLNSTSKDRGFASHPAEMWQNVLRGTPRQPQRPAALRGKHKD
jgi:hypothetical protein